MSMKSILVLALVLVIISGIQIANSHDHYFEDNVIQIFKQKQKIAQQIQRRNQKQIEDQLKRDDESYNRLAKAEQYYTAQVQKQSKDRQDQIERQAQWISDREHGIYKRLSQKDQQRIAQSARGTAAAAKQNRLFTYRELERQRKLQKEITKILNPNSQRYLPAESKKVKVVVGKSTRALNAQRHRLNRDDKEAVRKFRGQKWQLNQEQDQLATDKNRISRSERNRLELDRYLQAQRVKQEERRARIAFGQLKRQSKIEGWKNKQRLQDAKEQVQDKVQWVKDVKQEKQDNKHRQETEHRRKLTHFAAPKKADEKKSGVKKAETKAVVRKQAVATRQEKFEEKQEQKEKQNKLRLQKEAEKLAKQKVVLEAQQKKAAAQKILKQKKQEARKATLAAVIEKDEQARKWQLQQFNARVKAEEAAIDENQQQFDDRIAKKQAQLDKKNEKWE